MTTFLRVSGALTVAALHVSCSVDDRKLTADDLQGDAGSRSAGGVDGSAEGASAPARLPDAHSATPDAPMDSRTGETDGTISAPTCTAGATRKCGENVALRALGNCADGVEVCSNGVWGVCSVQPRPADACTSGDDANCNGTRNDGCPCTDGAKQSCGPAADVGECRRGVQTCAAGKWGDCEGAVIAKPRDCSSGLDHDCDGVADNKADASCACALGTSQSCEAHPDRDGKGRCRAGTQSCVVSADKRTSAFGPCSGSVGPAANDSCDVGNDDNCNGVPNDRCGCVDGDTQPCGPTADVGICHRGVQTCAAAQWGACVGAVYAAARDCTKVSDNDCNGTPDQSETSCACVGGSERDCSTALQGICKPGKQTCVLAADKKSSAWGLCTGLVLPAKDGCNPNDDQSCNGKPNEGCGCVNGATQPCGSSTGACATGVQTCANAVWGGECEGEIKAGPINCTVAGDGNCNGTEDQKEAACTTPCVFGAVRSCVVAGAKGTCAAGSQTCIAADNKQSVRWGTCVGPSPASADRCSPAWVDATCDDVNGCCPVRACGATCCPTAPPNTTTGCSGMACTAKCTVPLSCSTADGRNCGSWTFDSNDPAFEGWSVRTSKNSPTSTASLSYSSGRLAVAFSIHGSDTIYIETSLCGGTTGGAQIVNKTLHYELTLAGAAAPSPAMEVSPSLPTSDPSWASTYQVDSGRYLMSSLSITVPNIWQAYPSYLAHTLSIQIAVQGDFDRTIYLDNVSLK